MVDELFADYINKLNCPVPIARLGKNYYSFGTKKIYAKIINGKLVIRVGGGYMGIEEFMMYYGQQELLKMQKQQPQEEEDLSQEEIDDSTSNRKSYAGESSLDLDMLKKRLRENSVKKQRPSKFQEKSYEEESKYQDKQASTHVLGIKDVRTAMQGLIEIKTY